MSEEKMLTASEKEIMELLWEVKRPLSGTEIINLSENKTWKESYIHLLINSLLKKEMIQIDGFIKTTKNYARTFTPAMSEEEYAANQVSYSIAIKEEYVPFIVKTLLEKVNNKVTMDKIREIFDDKSKNM